MSEGFNRIALPPKGRMVRKRIFDIFCSALGIIVLSPLLLIAALAVGLTSRGGVFFKQERVGRGGKLFKIIKFRSMSRRNEGPKVTTGNDSRVTAVGRIIRKAKIDELPQLFNVLKGDMSFVGPRPEVPEYVALYNEEQRQVLLVKPGITGIASIRFRNENELLTESSDPEKTYIEAIMPKKIMLDLEYIPNAGVMYDFKLIIKTLLAVVKG